MKKNIILSLCMLLALGSYAQLVGEQGLPQEKRGEQSDEKRKEIEAQRIAYITTQLELTPEESAAFWPVFNQYQAELDAHRKSPKGKKPKRIDTENMSDAEIDELLKARFEHQRATIEIEEKYYDEFKKVLPTKKVAAFYKANDDFRKELLRSLKGRKDAERQRQRSHHEKRKAEKSLIEAKQEQEKAAEKGLLED